MIFTYVVEDKEISDFLFGGYNVKFNEKHALLYSLVLSIRSYWFINSSINWVTLKYVK